MAPSRRRPLIIRASAQAFTLIELLVVIAIIAILTAILLPVFASVREGSRQSVAISNMKDIQQKMEQFKLDNHKYPDVLFGYAYPGSTMKTGLAMAQAFDTANPGAHVAAAYFPGLYPAYIKDTEVFTDPNNPADPNSNPQVTPVVTDSFVIAPCSAANDNLLRGDTNSGCTGAASGAVVPTQRFFYIRDAYDSSPAVLNGNQMDTSNTKFITRYQVAREGTACSGVNTPAGCDATIPVGDLNYRKQLRWQNPPAETVVTMTPYHVQNADKVLVLFASGTVKKLKAEDFLAGNPDNSANFWKITP